MSDAVELCAAGAGDRAAIRALLEACALPVDGVPDDAAAWYVTARGGRVVGCAGLELHRGDGLLRSLAVAADFRGRELAAQLCSAIERRARAAFAACSC